MKVLHINNYDKKGGTETVFNLTRSNLKNVVNYSGYVKTGNSDERPDILFRTWEDDNKISGILNYIFSVYNYRVLKTFLEKSDINILHIHGFFSSLSPSILSAIKNIKYTKKIKVLQTLHDFHLICPNSSLFNYRKNTLCEKCIGSKEKLYILKENCDRRGIIFSVIKGIRGYVANNFIKHREVIDQFIVPSEFLKSKLIKDGISEEKICVIRNPIVKNSYANDIKKENIICYFGRFSKEKNLEFLINAFSLWKMKSKNNYQLLLIGEGEEADNLKMVAGNSSYGNDIIFKQYMPFEELVKEVSKAKFFALTSKCYENFPMSIMEAVSLDVIPIVPNIGGMQESVDKIFKIGSTYTVNSVESWLETIDNLESNYEKEIDKLLKTREKILSQLAVENYARQIFALYLK